MSRRNPNSRWAGAKPGAWLALLLGATMWPSLAGALPGGAAGALPTGELGPSLGQIPSIDDTTLAGAHVRLPADLRAAGGPCVLILGFSKAARAPVRAWGKRLAGPATGSPGQAASTQATGGGFPCFFEDPVLASVPRLLRGFVLRSIAAEVSERGKHHFLPITSDEARWRQLAGYADADAAYLLVVDAAGQVRWRRSGPLTEAAYAELRRQFAAAAAATTP